MPLPGQRSGSPWVVLPWSLISTKHSECGWRGHRAVGELEGEPWPLPFWPCQRRDLLHLALSVSLAALATRDSAGPPGLPFTWKGHLPHLYHLSGTCLSGSQITFHSQKTISILKRVSTLWGKKSEVEKCGQRASKLGLGHRKSLRPPPLPLTHTHMPAGESFHLLRGLLVSELPAVWRGLWGLSQGSQEIQRWNP